MVGCGIKGTSVVIYLFDWGASCQPHWLQNMLFNIHMTYPLTYTNDQVLACWLVREINIQPLLFSVNLFSNHM